MFEEEPYYDEGDILVTESDISATQEDYYYQELPRTPQMAYPSQRQQHF